MLHWVKVEVLIWQFEQSRPASVAMWVALFLKTGVTFANAIGAPLPWQFAHPAVIPVWTMLPVEKVVVLLWQVTQSRLTGVVAKCPPGPPTGAVFPLGVTPVEYTCPVWQLLQVVVLTPAWFMFHPAP
jgi:hypothetical protein